MMITTRSSAGIAGAETRNAYVRLVLVCGAALFATAWPDSTSPPRTPPTCALGALAADAEIIGTVGGGDCSLDLSGSSVGYVDYSIDMQQVSATCSRCWRNRVATHCGDPATPASRLAARDGLDGLLVAGQSLV